MDRLLMTQISAEGKLDPGTTGIWISHFETRISQEDSVGSVECVGHLPEQPDNGCFTCKNKGTCKLVDPLISATADFKLSASSEDYLGIYRAVAKACQWHEKLG